MINPPPRLDETRKRDPDAPVPLRTTNDYDIH
jgi:hypothetical protein